jgi:rubrerythrin
MRISGTLFRASNERKLTHAELIRAIRFMVSAEYEAIQMYMQLANPPIMSWPSRSQDIADEERVHAGEFLRLLKNWHRTKKNSTRGAEEVEEEMEKSKK